MKRNVTNIPLPDFPLWGKIYSKGNLLDFELEITARCNNNCRHCYINLPAGDAQAEAKELSLERINAIADEAVSMGALSCLITGGEPLLRQDFPDIYLSLKKKGLLLSVFTNAVLISEKHIRMFKQYPPREIEVSVYGVTRETYEKVTRKPGSFNSFMRGVDMFIKNGIKIRFKAVVMRSNFQEMPLIAEFCRKRTKDYFRFDPLLHLRFDGDEKRNKEIKAERLTPIEIARLEKEDPEKFNLMKENCDLLIQNDAHEDESILFRCGAGKNSCTIGYDGTFRLCSSLWQKDCIYDLTKGSLTEAYMKFVPMIRSMKTQSRKFMEKCGRCKLINLCMWCPAHAHLETGKLDEPVDFFCDVAHARAEMLKNTPK